MAINCTIVSDPICERMNQSALALVHPDLAWFQVHCQAHHYTTVFSVHSLCEGANRPLYALVHDIVAYLNCRIAVGKRWTVTCRLEASFEATNFVLAQFLEHLTRVDMRFGCRIHSSIIIDINKVFDHIIKLKIELYTSTMHPFFRRDFSNWVSNNVHW